jgi:hypothetical protein
MTAKHLRHLSKFTESEILEGVSKLNKNEQEYMDKLSKKLFKKMQTVDTTKLKQPDKKKRKASINEIFIEVLATIEQSLTDYEKSETIDEWIIDFEVGIDYQNTSKEDIILLHKKLLTSDANTLKIALLIKAERGKMYNVLKFSERWSNDWSGLCIELKLCSSTARRYIDFFRVINAYPRLLICMLSFETIMKCFKPLTTYLTKKENQQLTFRLQEPLRQTALVASKTILPDNLPKGGDPPVRQLSTGASWDAGWELSDIILNKTEPDCNDQDYEEEEEEEEEEGEESIINGMGDFSMSAGSSVDKD